MKLVSTGRTKWVIMLCLTVILLCSSVPIAVAERNIIEEISGYPRDYDLNRYLYVDTNVIRIRDRHTNEEQTIDFPTRHLQYAHLTDSGAVWVTMTEPRSSWDDYNFSLYEWSEGSVRKITDGVGYDSIRDKGDYIAFVARRDGQHQVWLLDKRDHSYHNVTNNNSYPYWSLISLSPDGHLAYTTTGNKLVLYYNGQTELTDISAENEIAYNGSKVVYDEYVRQPSGQEVYNISVLEDGRKSVLTNTHYYYNRAPLPFLFNNGWIVYRSSTHHILRSPSGEETELTIPLTDNGVVIPLFLSSGGEVIFGSEKYYWYTNAKMNGSAIMTESIHDSLVPYSGHSYYRGFTELEDGKIYGMMTNYINSDNQVLFEYLPVPAKIKAISIPGEVNQLSKGESQQIHASAAPPYATETALLSCASSDESVVTISCSDDGTNYNVPVLINAVGGGTATVTIRAKDNISRSWNVNVYSPLEGLSLDQTRLTLNTDNNKTAQLRAIFHPADATDKDLTWSSTNPDVADVDANGLVTAKKKGTTMITATSGSFTANCIVTVQSDQTDTVPPVIFAAYATIGGKNYPAVIRPHTNTMHFTLPGSLSDSEMFTGIRVHASPDTNSGNFTVSGITKSYTYTDGVAQFTVQLLLGKEFDPQGDGLSVRTLRKFGGFTLTGTLTDYTGNVTNGRLVLNME
ncbi:Ig-like domain-containing protein [Paenibacillus tarimensis]|uniref:Ig-like domain-containing protein n=1 Tax=Paenibacillus tarimensis TaxID=416012 RepID=UPI001F3877EC|nr:Ig-like domain-containing protein [Paenibacillus tarimensis]MCF2945519.1 Ig-like domain-containing protein [Paenibacillus tarimensis]